MATERKRVSSWVLLALVAALLVVWFAINLIGGRVGG
jgi:uncharacterized membrane protein